MLGPQFLKTPSGDELVVLERVHYDALVAVATAGGHDSPEVRLALAIIRLVEQSPFANSAQAAADA